MTERAPQTASTSRSPWRWLLLAAPFVVVGAVPRATMQTIAGAAAEPLAMAAAELEEALPSARPPAALPPTPQAAEIAAIEGDPLTDEADRNDTPSTSDEPASSAPATRLGTSPRLEPPPTSGVMVSRGRVLAAAKAGIRPSGSSIAKTSWRPSGLALHGVSAVGVGLRDGDVVTRVGGTRATSQGAVIGAVTAALRQKLPAITAEVWRGRHRIVVTVELPEVEFEDDPPSR